MKEIDEKIYDLGIEVKELKRRLDCAVVGEYYAEKNRAFTGCSGWRKLCQNDITDEIDGNVKIKVSYGTEVWVKKSDIIMYNDIEKQKKSVERRNTKEEEWN